MFSCLYMYEVGRRGNQPLIPTPILRDELTHWTTIKPTSSVNCYGKISTDIVLNLSSLSNPLQYIKKTLFYRVPPLGIQNYWLLLHELQVWAKRTCSFPKRKEKTLSFLFYYTSPFYLFKNKNCFGDTITLFKIYYFPIISA